MPWYTILTVVAMAAVVAVELLVIRSGIFRNAAYWIALGICAAFQVPVDGWLTDLPTPIVIYNSEVFSDIRIFWDSPIEDWGFGFALMTLALAIWVRLGRDEERDDTVDPSPGSAESARA
jgi:lycopene cyclase domain-containing protein